MTRSTLSFFTLLLLISFASVNAVLFTPALPDIASFFNISDDIAQQTMTWFLVAYALGQLVYGPLANRFGRKPTLYMGVSLQIIASLICVAAGSLECYPLLVIGRFLLALGSGVGLKMTFTIINESYEPKEASQKISYLMLAFAVTPGLAIALGGVLNEHFGWMSCFYVGAVYGLILLALITQLPETLKTVNLNALKFSHLSREYRRQFKNVRLIAGGLLMGGSTAFVYIFAALAPFIAIDVFGMSSEEYGLANILPTVGLVLGSVASAKLVTHYSLTALIHKGIFIASAGVIVMLFTTAIHLSPWFSLFLPMILIYFGLSLVLPNASALAMQQVSDKAHGSAVMNFVNMGTATLAVLSLGYLPSTTIVLPLVYIFFCIILFGLYQWMVMQKSRAPCPNA